MIRGWCPSVHAPMATGDGYLVRVKPRGGRLSASAARLLTAAVRRHGNGGIELTRRASLQIRGLGADDVAPFAAAMVAAGLASADPGAERRRNVISAPFADAATVAAVETALENAGELPGKFGVSVDSGPVGLDDGRADIMLRLAGDAWRVSVDGGVLSAAVASPGDAVTALTTAFPGLGGVRRMRDLVAAVGDAVVFEAAGIPPSPCGLGLGGGVEPHDIRRACHPSPNPLPQGEGAFRVGFMNDSRAFGVGLPFGQITTDGLALLADLAERFGDGALRLSPWRAIYLGGVTEPLQVGAADLIVQPDDPRLRLHACVGQPGCASATVDARADAMRLARAGVRDVHVSGCAKGCAHPAPARVTLVGNRGRYDLVRNGAACDTPFLTCLSFDEAMAAA